MHKFLWTLPFFCFLVGYLAMSAFYPRKSLETPNLVGLSITQAATILSKLKVNLRLLEQKEDALLPEGTIINQTPAAGQKIKPQQSLYIVSSKKPAALAVPSYIHKPLSLIESDLKSKSLRAKIYQVKSNYPAGVCFAQFPPAGSVLEPNKALIIYIASNQENIVIFPDFKGKSVKTTLDFLSTHHIKVNLIQGFEQIAASEELIVVDQRPLGGSMVQIETGKPLIAQICAK